MSQSIAQLLEELLAAWNDHDPARAGLFYAEDYYGTDVGQHEPQIGREARMQVLKSYIHAFPDLHFTGESVVEGNRAVLIWTMHGTHGAPILGIPATGRLIKVQGVSILTIEGRLITRGVTIWDTAGFLRALKLLPEL
jgi:steroid delta-isomerase-like uncharacterized protein